MSDSEGSASSGRASSGRARSGRASSRSSSRSSASSLESFDSFHSDDSPTQRRNPQKRTTMLRQNEQYMRQQVDSSSKRAPTQFKVKHTVYSINFNDNTITHIDTQGNRIVKKINPSAREVLLGMTESMRSFGNMAYLVDDDNQNLENIDNIFRNLSKGGSRRRRPSRKYKKSKRVLRRKSRSTRRR